MEKQKQRNRKKAQIPKKKKKTREAILKKKKEELSSCLSTYACVFCVLFLNSLAGLFFFLLLLFLPVSIKRRRGPAFSRRQMNQGLRVQPTVN